MLHMYDELKMRAAYKKIFFNAKKHPVFVQIDTEYYLDIFETDLLKQLSQSIVLSFILITQ